MALPPEERLRVIQMTLDTMENLRQDLERERAELKRELGIDGVSTPAKLGHVQQANQAARCTCPWSNEGNPLLHDDDCPLRRSPR